MASKSVKYIPARSIKIKPYQIPTGENKLLPKTLLWNIKAHPFMVLHTKNLKKEVDILEKYLKESREDGQPQS